MSCISHTRHILMRDGTNQFERLLDALGPVFVMVDERSKEDLARFIRDFAELVQYYDASDNRDGNWETFFDDFSRTDEPMIALMLTFLELFRKAQDHLNDFTLRHLEYYYKRILQVREKPAQPDRLHLLIDLAKNISEFKLDAGTLFKAGKDATGKELVYASETEIVLNKARVESLKAVFHDKAPEGKLYAAPVANSADGQGAQIESPEARWFTFGKNQSGLFGPQRTMPDGRLGMAIASPLLFLAEGERTIRLNFQFHQLSPSDGKTLADILSLNFAGVFQAYLSGKKNWIGPLEVTVMKTTDNKGMDLTIHLGPGDEAVVAYSRDVLKEPIYTALPVTRIEIDCNHEPSPLNDLLLLRAKSLNVSVSVKGVKDLVLQNETGRLDASKPFQPFGPAPGVGSRFYIGSSEAFGKKLDSLELCFQWKDLPGTFNGFDGYYSLYGGNYTTSGFKMAVSALEEKTWSPSSGRENIELFDLNSSPFEVLPVAPPVVKDTGGFKKKRLSRKKVAGDMVIENKVMGISGSEFVMDPMVFVPGVFFFTLLSKSEIRRKIDVSKLNLQLHPSPENFPEFSHAASYGFLRMELTGQDFGHKEYPSVHTKQAIALSKHILDGASGNPPALPNAPYTPMLEYLAIDYSASENIALEGVRKTAGTFYHLEPFGACEAMGTKAGSGVNLLPSIPFEGALYIGIKDLEPRQNISLLFQFAESSAGSESFIDPQDLEWSYLGNDQWVPLLRQEIISDSTNNFLTSGIMVLDVSRNATNGNSRMPGDLHWLRLAARYNALGVNQLIDVKAQAVTAVFSDKGNDPAHLENALAAETIAKLASARPEVKKVVQPFASFGGRPAEVTQSFCNPYYTRISERLRHKNRIVTIWDAERMVLEEFPKTYKVKCLNHSGEKNDISPGSLAMVVIENIRNKNAVNPFQPRTSLDTLAKIRSYIEKYVSPFVIVHVQNPIYEEILVDFKVSFHPGYDAGFYRQKLNEEIRKFLSPWAYVEGEDIIFGNIIYKSSIVNFIEKREYVDFITDFKMFQIVGSWGIGCMEVGDDFVVGDQEKILDLEEARAKTSRSILVSAQEHDIYVLSPGEYVCEGSAY